MGRCGLYNEGVDIFKEYLEGKVEFDWVMVWCLFILICVFYIWV